nr:hypothetical protein [Bacillus subtilis]
MAMNLRKNQAPLYIKVHEIDNTAIIVNDGGLPKGTVFSCGLVLEEDVPQGHKVALTDLNQGDEIVRYGEVIGFADETIKRGSWIREALVRMPAPPALDDLPLANRVPQPRPHLKDIHLKDTEMRMAVRGQKISSASRQVFNVLLAFWIMQSNE